MLNVKDLKELLDQYDEDMEICIRTPNAFIYSLEKQPFEADSNGICFLCFDTEK